MLGPDLPRLGLPYASIPLLHPLTLIRSCLHSVPPRTADDQGLPFYPPNVPDGLQVDELGNIFATGPAGVLVFSPDGSPLGMIDPGIFSANVAMGRDGYLYMAARQSIMRIKVSTKALRWQ